MSRSSYRWPDADDDGCRIEALKVVHVSL